MLDPQSHRADVVVRLPNAAGAFAHGGATATFHLGRAAAAVAVPLSAVVESKGESVVFVVDAGVARRTPVVLGLHDGDWVGVAGLPVGATVVVAGNT